MNEDAQRPPEAAAVPAGSEEAGPPDTGPAPHPEAADRIPDNYYKGVIEKIFRGSRSGIVRSASGRELTFKFDLLRFAGGPRQFDELREGARVGFDVGHTANGLLVTVLRLED